MKRGAVVVFTFVFASGLIAQSVAERVALDGAVVDRVAAASQRDLPVSLLQRIVKEDIELMRGLRPDGTYEYATRERFEAGRITESFTVKPGDESLRTFELKGAFVYRLILDVPSRRLLIRKNLPVWIERVDIEFIAENARMEQISIEIKAWLQPGELRPVDLPVVARQATARIVASADPKGYSNLKAALIQARVVDDALSPFAVAVAGAKEALKALDKKDIASLRLAAQRMRDGVGRPIAAVPETPAVRAAPATPATMTVLPDSGMIVELRTELQLVEDLLTGTEAERREGMDRLHQLLRRLR